MNLAKCNYIFKRVKGFSYAVRTKFDSQNKFNEEQDNYRQLELNVISHTHSVVIMSMLWQPGLKK